MTRPIPQIALDFIAENEDEILHVYDDADQHHRELVPGDVVKGNLTAGIGHTGSDVVIGMTVTPEMSRAWLATNVETAAMRLSAKVPDDVLAMLTDQQYSALLDFVFNAGTGNPDKPEWTIWKRLRAKEFDQVPGELTKFVNGVVDGQMVKIKGLVNRRAAETVLWATGEPGTSQSAPPSSVTRTTDTPPTPSDPVPASKSKALILGGAGALAGAGPMVDQVSHVVAPYAEHSHYVQTMLAILATVAAICAVSGLAYVWLQKRNARN